MKKILFFLLLALLPFLFPSKVSAEVIHSFDTTITSHKNGVIDVSEKINYDFENIAKHGIYRYIPTYAKVGDLYRVYKISNISIFRDGRKEQFSNSIASNQLNLKIGNPDKTMTGAHLYEIDYTVENGIGSNYSDHDEIYWNSTGNGWIVSIEKASITFDTDFNISPTKVLCFTGSYGSKDANCEVFENLAKTTGILNPSEGLSGVASYSVGTFPKSILSKELPKTVSEKVGQVIFRNLFNIYLFLNIILPIILFFWYQKHKNKKRFGSPSVNFDIPKDSKGERIAPAEAGTIDSAKLERDDVTATIFDLAIKKYIKLSEEKITRKLLPDSSNQKIKKLKDSEGLNTFEKELYDRLFQDGDEILVSDMRADFYETFAQMETSVFTSLVSRGFYFKNPKVQRSILFILGTFALFSGSIILSIILFYLGRKLIGRTIKGDEMDFKIDGLKLFLKKMDRNYNWQAEKFYTVEQMIPYAMALGYIDKFMEQLKILKPDYNPYWYSGYRGSFYANYALFYTGIASSITTAAPSSSGSGGGGFSGGGGGGGGGGSW